MNLLKILEGKKTYITAAAVFIVGGLQATGVIEPALANQILTFLGGLGLVTLRTAMTKL